MQPQQATQHTPDRTPSIDCFAIVLISVLPIIILRPFQNTPFIDDWSFAWPVQRLLQHGDIKFLEYSHANIVQIIWGALFCIPFGFSFTALRVSTWVASVACLLGLYFTLREFNVSRRDSLIGVGVLAAYPIYFVLSFTFMSDIPCLAAMVWSCLALVRALRLQSDRWLLVSVSWATLGIGVREVAAAVPPIAMLVLLLHSDGWGRRKPRLLLQAIPVVALGALMWFHSTHIEYSADLSSVANSPANRTIDLKDALPSLPKMLPVNFTFVACALGIALLPLVAGCLRKRDVTRAAAIAAALGVALLVQTIMKEDPAWPLEPGSTWEINRLGETDSLVPDYNDADWPRLAGWGVPIISVLLGAMRLALLVKADYRGYEAVLTWFMLGQFMLLAILWLFYDRYALVFVPSSIVVLLSRNRVVRPILTFTLISIFALVSLAGMRDHLEYNRSLWGAVEYLHQRGVNDSMIDAGYVVNGWQQYAHPENAPHNKGGEIYIPGFTTNEQNVTVPRIKYRSSGLESVGELFL